MGVVRLSRERSARCPLPAGQRWALQAVATSMLSWFVVDATGSVLHGAWFNVWMVDAPSLLAVALPWAFARRGCHAAVTAAA